MTHKTLTADQVKEQFKACGLTVTAWARKHKLPRAEVYRVLNGQSKARYGRGHEIAVMLGIKTR